MITPFGKPHEMFISKDDRGDTEVQDWGVTSYV